MEPATIREVLIIANYITLGMVSRPCVPEGGREVSRWSAAVRVFSMSL